MAVVACGAFVASGALAGCRKAFGAHPVLTGVDLEVPAGSLTAVLGPSGSGKTTLLRLMVGFERADAGTIGIGDVLVDGPGVHLPPERRRIGYVPQEGSLFPHLTVAGNVGFGPLRDGKIAQCAPPEELYRRPADPGLARFIGDANLLDGVLDGGVVKTLLGRLPLDPAVTSVGAAGQVTVLIRPEQIDIEPNEAGIPARVMSYRYHGHDAVLHVQPGK